MRTANPTKHATLGGYVTGFVLAVGLSLLAYVLAVRHAISGNSLTAVLLGLALTQLIVQLFFFLHIGTETKPRWKLATLVASIVVVLILVIGSIWIMYNLDYSHTPDQVNKYLQSQGGSDL